MADAATVAARWLTTMLACGRLIPLRLGKVRFDVESLEKTRASAAGARLGR